MKFKKIIYIALGVVFFSTASCKKILEPVPNGTPDASLYYNDYYGALTGINGAYAALAQVYARNSTNSGDYWLFDALSDDATNAGTGQGGENSQQWENLNIDRSNGQVLIMWQNIYRTVYRANVQILYADGVYEKEVGNRKVLVRQFAGEAYFLRALLYYHLVRAWGGVPLMTTPESEPEKLRIPRSTAAEVYQQIIADANKAVEYLPTQYPNPLTNGTTGITAGGNELGRATKGAAYALLSSVYLTLNDLDKSLDNINNLKAIVRTSTPTGVYTLMPEYFNNYPTRGGTENNAESIFEIQYAPTGTSINGIGLAFDPVINGGGYGYNRPTDINDATRPILGGGIRQAYIETDKRLPININYIGSPLTPRIYKFIPDVAAERSTAGFNWPVFRFAEILLNEAEIYQAKGNIPLAKAAVDRIRSRAGIPTLTALNINDPIAVRDTIRLERRRELAFETKRWFDLNRWGTTVQTMISHGRTMQDFQKILPIPIQEFNANPALVQNPGY